MLIKLIKTMSANFFPLVIIACGVILLVVIALAIYVFIMQRQFVHLDELCRNAISQIDVQLNSRWDAVQSLARMTAQYARHESETILATIRERRRGNVMTAEQANEQQYELQQVTGRLIAIGEAYPDLKAESVFRETMQGMREWEEKVRMSRMVYNDIATKMNRLVRQWPSAFVASLLNFRKYDYMQLDDSRKANYPDIDDVFRR